MPAMLPFAETAAPSWLAAIFIAVPVALMFYLGWRALRTRARVLQAVRSPLATGRDPSLRPGDAAAIADAGVVPFASLLVALSATAAGSPDDPGEDSYTAQVGLIDRSYDSYRRANGGSDTQSGSAWHLADGVRDERQVVLRRGDDETSFGFSLVNRHTLHQLLIRARFPSFSLTGEDGRLQATTQAPQAVVDLIGGLARSDAWSPLRVVAGPKGIVFVRPGDRDMLGGYAYDLWLGERLATTLAAPPLAVREITKSFRMPYGTGRANSLLSIVRSSIGR